MTAKEVRLEKDPEDIDLIIEIGCMKDRINFAWQDDEYDHDHAELPFEFD